MTAPDPSKVLPDPSKVVEIEGQIYYKDSISNVKLLVVTVFDGLSLENLEDQITYIGDDGTSKQVLPKEADEVRFIFAGQEIRMLSRKPSNYASGKKFVHLLVDARLRVYEYIKTYRTGRARSTSRVNNVVYLLLQRGNEKISTPYAMNFQKKMSRYFSDCPKLANMISTKLLGRQDMQQIVTMYNNNICE